MANYFIRLLLLIAIITCHIVSKADEPPPLPSPIIDTATDTNKISWWESFKNFFTSSNDGETNQDNRQLTAPTVALPPGSSLATQDIQPTKTTEAVDNALPEELELPVNFDNLNNDQYLGKQPEIIEQAITNAPTSPIENDLNNYESTISANQVTEEDASAIQKLINEPDPTIETGNLPPANASADSAVAEHTTIITEQNKNTDQLAEQEPTKAGNLAENLPKEVIPATITTTERTPAPSELSGYIDNAQNNDQAIANLDTLPIPEYSQEFEQQHQNAVQRFTQEIKKNKVVNSLNLPQISSQEFQDTNQEKLTIKFDPKQIEFVENESQVLLLPDDDVVLGKVTASAELLELEMYAYIQQFWQNYAYLESQPRRDKIEHFIMTYYPDRR